MFMANWKGIFVISDFCSFLWGDWAKTLRLCYRLGLFIFPIGKKPLFKTPLWAWGNDNKFRARFPTI
jgi:hypothetical protein